MYHCSIIAVSLQYHCSTISTHPRSSIRPCGPQDHRCFWPWPRSGRVRPSTAAAGALETPGPLGKKLWRGRYIWISMAGCYVFYNVFEPILNGYVYQIKANLIRHMMCFTKNCMETLRLWLWFLVSDLHHVLKHPKAKPLKKRLVSLCFVAAVGTSSLKILKDSAVPVEKKNWIRRRRASGMPLKKPRNWRRRAQLFGILEKLPCGPTVQTAMTKQTFQCVDVFFDWPFCSLTMKREGTHFSMALCING